MKKLPIPKEHGAYIVLIASWLVGVVIGGYSDIITNILILVSAFSFFLLGESLRLAIKSRIQGQKPELSVWTLLLLLIAITTSALVLLHAPWLLWFAPHIILFIGAYSVALSQRARTIALTYIGFGALSLLAPIVVCANNQGASDILLIALWVGCALFFAASAATVNIRFDGKRGIAPAVVVHVLAFNVIGVWVHTGHLTHGFLTAMLLAIIRFIIVLVMRERYQKLALKYIGIQESFIAALLIVSVAII
jgi:hypothetical protein